MNLHHANILCPQPSPGRSGLHRRPPFVGPVRARPRVHHMVLYVYNLPARGAPVRAAGAPARCGGSSRDAAESLPGIRLPIAGRADAARPARRPPARNRAPRTALTSGTRARGACDLLASPEPAARARSADRGRRRRRRTPLRPPARPRAAVRGPRGCLHARTPRVGNPNV